MFRWVSLPPCQVESFHDVHQWNPNKNKDDEHRGNKEAPAGPRHVNFGSLKKKEHESGQEKAVKCSTQHKKDTLF